MASTNAPPSRGLAWLFGPLLGGLFWAALGSALVVHGIPPLEYVAPLLALAIVGEGLVISRSQGSHDPVLSFSGLAHVAAAVLVGSLGAALVAAVGVVVADGLRADARRHVVANSALFGGSIWLAAEAFQLAGGSSDLSLRSLPALALLVGVRYLTTSLVLAVGTALASARSLPVALKEILLAEASASLGEGSLGFLLAFAVATESWIIFPLLVPPLFSFYRSRATFERLKEETGDALRSIAEVIDERDRTTAEHTRRVSEYVARFCAAIKLGERETERLVSAARLHDLGKIVVDVATLTKAGKLTESELRAIRRHPRLSARLLSPFSFAKEIARFVEFHHERYDGRGYYSVPPQEIPIEAHVLIVADSFDAMTSRRPYRPALTRDEAAAEIVDSAGTQFHPLVARAFAAVVLDEDVGATLGPADLAALRSAFTRVPIVPTIPLSGLAAPRNVTLGLAVAGLVLVVSPVPAWVLVSAAGAFFAAGGWWGWSALRSRRLLSRALAAAVRGDDPHRVLEGAGMPGWVGSVVLDEESGALRIEAVSGAAYPAELDEVRECATRREDAFEARLAGGGYLVATAEEHGARVIACLLACPSRAGRRRLERLLPHLRPRADVHLALVPDADRRVPPSEQRAVIVVELQLFEAVRQGAGHLFAARVVNEAERRLRRLVREEDELVRMDEDRLAVVACGVGPGGVLTLAGRVESEIRQLRLPRNVRSREPVIRTFMEADAATEPEVARLLARVDSRARALAG